MTHFDYSVFVAGGTSGINLGIAQAFARAGARVAVASRSQDKVDAAEVGLRESGAKAIGFAADVRQYDAVEAAPGATAAQWGPIECAGVRRGGQLRRPACPGAFRVE
jgi:NAD(P)-dependent dehydrogenase (short-subunit alcohol dehydrogenase family)